MCGRLNSTGAVVCVLRCGSKPGLHITSSNNLHQIWLDIRCYASAVLAMALCPCLCPSVISRCSVETDERIELVFGV